MRKSIIGQKKSWGWLTISRPIDIFTRSSISIIVTACVKPLSTSPLRVFSKIIDRYPYETLFFIAILTITYSYFIGIDTGKLVIIGMLVLFGSALTAIYTKKITDSNSPSFHTSVGVSLSMYAFVISIYTIPVFTLLAILTPVARVYGGQHTLKEALYGAINGIIWGVCGAIIFIRL